MKLPIYNDLAKEMASCNSCGLGGGLIDGQDPHVLGQGDLNSKVVFIAEAPGYQETVYHKPLTPPGKSGAIYEKLLAAIGLSREQVYTMNVLVCRPPDNRDPDLHEIHRCKPFFERQLKLVNPKLVVTFGRFAASCLLGEIKITLDHGKVKHSEKFSVDVFPMYHPAYVGAYASADKRVEFKQDTQYLKKLIKSYMEDG